jgi:hypothetical protein
LVVVEQINVITPVTAGASNGSRNPLTPITKEYLDFAWPNSTNTGVPVYFAPVDGETFLVGPAPDAAYVLEVVGTQRVARALREDEEDAEDVRGLTGRVLRARAGVSPKDPLIVVDIVVPEAELVRRLETRLICHDCGTNAPIAVSAAAACTTCGGKLVHRADDNEAVVLERLKVYHEMSEPLVEYYRVRPTFRSIDGAQAPDRVAADLVAAIEAAGVAVRHGARG